MDHLPRIQLVNHRDLVIAQQLHAVQMIAYAQEAKLLGAIYFPPLERTVTEVQTSDENYLAAFMGDDLVGAVSVGPDSDGVGLNVASLVVTPQFQHQGIGAALMSSVLATHGNRAITVQTGVKNQPALSLYSRLGFTEIRRWFVGREPLELVKLLRTPNVTWKREKNAA